MHTASMKRNRVIGKVFLYLVLIIITALMIIPFLWMLSASIKSNTEVFKITPFQFIPDVPRWDNYKEIWTKIPLMNFIGNTVFLTIVVTFLQLLTSSLRHMHLQNWSSNIKMHCSLLILQPLQCHGRYTWCRSSS